ncbi:hypothetical protein EUTSA_v10029331mg, partial [Eutrema salsugineum]
MSGRLGLLNFASLPWKPQARSAALDSRKRLCWRLGATVFPHNIGLGATRRIVTTTELGVRATGVHWAFASYEAVSSLVSGVKGVPPEEHLIGYHFVAGGNNVIACAKHFVRNDGTK